MNPIHTYRVKPHTHIYIYIYYIYIYIHEIAITNIVWCTAYKMEGRSEGVYCPMVVQ